MLLVTADPDRGRRWFEGFRASKCEVEWVPDGFCALARLHERSFDVVFVDDSCKDFGSVELGLNIRDLSANSVIAIFGAGKTPQYAKVSERCGFVLVMPDEELEGVVDRVVTLAKQRKSEDATGR